MNNKNLLTILLYNLLVLIFWGALSIAFNAWWIVLFSILFVCALVFKRKHYRICDSCGKHSTLADTREEAVQKAQDAGWQHFPNEDLDYCPDCQGEHYNETR